jgi:5-methylcytosine-specific restriction endonuclease McrA
MEIRRPLQAKPLKNDPEKARAWQQRSAEKAIARMREKGAKLAPREAEGRKPALAAGSRLPSSAALKRSAKSSKSGGLNGTGSSLRGSTTRKASTSRPKHNDGPWRNAVMAARGEQCRSCGDTRHVEADHVIPKSQDSTARADVENGLPLCGAFSGNTPGGCHPAKTAGALKFEFEWFDPDQIEYLKAKGYVDWDEHGQPFGRGMKHFQPRRTRLGTMEGGQAWRK